MPILTIILLFIGGALGLIYLWYLFALVYHLIRFGVGLLPKVLAFVFFLGSFLLFALTMLLFLNINWQNLLNSILQLLQIT